MAALDVRFRPPRLTLPVERRWPFVRALGPADAALPSPLDGAEAGRVALALDLAARIGARLTLQRLADELGRAPALRLFATHARQAARSLALVALARELAEVAQAVRAPVSFLKSAALALRGLAPPETRPAGDLDVLVPEDRAGSLADALCRRGFHPADVPAGAHQLTPLVDEQGLVVEIHRFLPGLRVPGSSAGQAGASFEALESAGALAPLAGLPGRASTPALPLLAAHAVAHGLVQSGYAPHVYSLTRLLADAVDLGLPSDDDLATRAFPWIEGTVTRCEYQGLLALVRRLAAGDQAVFDEAAQGQATAEAVLLRHVVAGALDPDYRRALRARAALRGAGHGPRALARAIRRALVLSEAQIDAIYGRPAGPLGYGWRRLLRPFDLGLRLLRARSAGRGRGPS